MLSREEFIFTIGYDGPVAVVDKQAKKKYGKLSTRQLAEKGFFRAAYSSAICSGDQEELKFVAEAYNQAVGQSASDSQGTNPVQANLASMDRLFGVFPVDVKRSLYL